MPGKQSLEHTDLDKSPVADKSNLLRDTAVDYGVPDPSIYLARDKFSFVRYRIPCKSATIEMVPDCSLLVK